MAHSLKPHIACNHIDRSAGAEAPVPLCQSETLTVEGMTGDQQCQMPLTDPATHVQLLILAQLHKGGHYASEAERSQSYGRSYKQIAALPIGGFLSNVS